ncbi:unnamed protein product [Didymodactylos carnosus]|uniref:Uncharacterized protein n=1 Tax=Didymodactylos carnosus TaxID=1234261 RepID=A0A8S2HRD1_9BILA|nr:unnamed protein product [Didymodactylos carnosus]CAF3651583.1 unnamed protein product [Didymodactylos carnosus]
MFPSQIEPLFWNYWANIVYILGSIGYMFMNLFCLVFCINKFVYASFVLYVILAILFVIDAILYTIDWYTYAVLLRKSKNIPINYKAEFTACIFQILGSYCYLLGAILAENKTKYMPKILALNVAGIFSLVLEATFTIVGWQITLKNKTYFNRGCCAQDIYLWAHVLNLTADLIYLLATIIAVLRFQMDLIRYPATVQLLQIIGDIVYVVDSLLYMRCYMREKDVLEEKRAKENNEKETVSQQKYDNRGLELESILGNNN